MPVKMLVGDRPCSHTMTKKRTSRSRIDTTGNCLNDYTTFNI